MIKKYDAIIIGSGAAAYSAADWLFREGVTDIAVITENRLSGTSRNTGSDKQTYYKLSVDGKTADSAYKMAEDICSQGCCDGELAYIQAVNSIRCFMRLCDYGVNFPRDIYGGFPGYKTDHDDTLRATSVGPYTSKIMTEKLEEKVIDINKTPVFDKRQVIEIITDKKNDIEAKVAGVVVLNLETDMTEIFASNNIICATGAPACIYKDSVYPESQHGMTGVLVDAGVMLCNFSQWQYGLASVDHRWNVSGSFMQVIPRFVSVDKDGIEREFLKDIFPDIHTANSFVFLKGYQWPFSYERMNESSAIDLAVHGEIIKGRRVYLDYTRNPDGYCFNELSREAKEYLIRADAVADTPFERLSKLNKKAIEVYSSIGIDISSQKLRIAVCAQHNNGGAFISRAYLTTVDGLYVIGEAAGSFGLARPGGSALNDTQVGGLVAARYIKNAPFSYETDSCVAETEKRYSDLIKTFRVDETVDYSYICSRMSECAAIVRDREKCQKLLYEITSILDNLPFRHRSLSLYFYDRDMLISAKALLETVLGEMTVTGSRGGAIYTENSEIIDENTQYRKYLTVTEAGKIFFTPVKGIPTEDEPFEKYLNRIN